MGSRQKDRGHLRRHRRPGTPAADRRAAVQGPRRAEGRRHEVRPGPVGLRVGAPRGGRRPVPRGPDQAPGGRAAPARGDRPRGAAGTAGRGLALAVPLLRRPPRRGRLHRPGAPRGLARRAHRRGQGPVPGGGRGPPLRPGPAQPLRPPAGPAGPRAGREAADHRVARPRLGGTGLRPGGGGAAHPRRGVRRRPLHAGPRCGAPERPGAGDGVAGGHPALRGHRRGHRGTAGLGGPAALPLPLLRPRPHGPAPRRPAPGQLPPGPRRGRGRLAARASSTSARSTACPAACRRRSAPPCA